MALALLYVMRRVKTVVPHNEEDLVGRVVSNGNAAFGYMLNLMLSHMINVLRVVCCRIGLLCAEIITVRITLIMTHKCLMRKC